MQRASRFSEAAKHERFTPLDGLRAIAAFMVSLWHFQHSVPVLDAHLPVWLSRAVAHANIGVDVFFVLSGFAVARSLVGARLGVRTIARFMLRRGLRLDPPYAVTVALVVILSLLRPEWWPIRPTVGRVVAHLFYLQGILALPNFLGIFWTLCLEIQLYFALAVSYSVAQRVRLVDETREELPSHAFSAILSVSALAAAAYALTPNHLPGDVWFVGWWPVFALGVLTERAVRLRASRPWLFVTAAVLLASNAWTVQISTLTALVTMTVMMLAAAPTPLRRVLGSRALTALGRISYSFYLMHSLVGGMAVHAASKYLPSTLGGDLVRLAIAYLASIAATLSLYFLAERPAQRWSRRIRLA
jgi:peptidoglycan/LPS O-acetylase OafA/YrhL